jgi:phage/plasmid-associated DNA primase
VQLELLPGGVDEQPHRGRREGQPKTRPPELPDGRPNHWSCSIATCDWKVEENDFDAAITKLFEDMYPDHQDREHVWKAFGYGITGHAFERCLLVIEGETRSGKTTLTEPVHATLGPGYARVAASELLIRMSGKHSSVVADVIDARIVFIDDPYEGAKMDNNLVKQITGGDPVNTRRLYEQSHDSTVRMLPILVTNHVPGTHVLEAPIAERLHMTLTAGTVKPEKRDPLLKHKLKTDAGREAILRWLVRGAHEWHRAFKASQSRKGQVQTGLGRATILTCSPTADRPNPLRPGPANR